MKRAQPLLGTVVEIRVDGLPDTTAHAAIDRGFAAIADIHRLMSFHEPDSDVSRLNRAAANEPVEVDPHTFEVIRRAAAFSAASDGLFDITVGAHLVAWGFLPPPGPRLPDPAATWRDIIPAGENHLALRRPLWIDLGGIAKGYAVDQAVAAMDLGSNVQACVNAGGDLRVCGPQAENVWLRTALAHEGVPMVSLADGALASSSGAENTRKYQNRTLGPHVDPAVDGGLSVGAERFVSVTAPHCITADALTKIVLADGPRTEPVLCHFGAIAYFYQVGAGWSTLGADGGGADKGSKGLQAR